MSRKQNDTRETAECHGTQQYKRERQQNAKETEQYNRDNTRYFLFRDRKIHLAAVTMISRIPAHPH